MTQPPTESASVAFRATDDQFRAYLRTAGAAARLTPPWFNIAYDDAQFGRADEPVELDVQSGFRRSARVFTTLRPFESEFAAWLVEQAGDAQRQRFWLDRPNDAAADATLRVEVSGDALDGERDSDARLAWFAAERAAHDCERIARFADTPRLRVAIAGATGLIGSHLAWLLDAAGHTVQTISRRRQASPLSIVWDPAKQEIDADALAETDVIVNLAGANIAEGRWNEKRKAAIRNSRIDATTLLARTASRLPQRARALINASATGYYPTGDGARVEGDEAGDRFLSVVCRDWESATAPAVDAGLRVAFPRIGVVLSPRGGALRAMLPIFRAGLAGRLGAGKQYMSWVALDDVVGLLFELIHRSDLSGPFNATGPHPVTNAEYTRVLASVLGKRPFLPAPAFAIRLALGEMGSELLLKGTRVLPERTLASGFDFGWATLEEALRFELALPE